MNARGITDLRGALRHCAERGQPIDVVEEELDPRLEIPAHLASKGVGVPGRSGAISNPTIYARPKGYDIPVLIGLLGRRAVCADLLGLDAQTVGAGLADFVGTEYAPRYTEAPPCQEHVIALGDRRVEEILPLPVFAPGDAGPYVNMGVVLAEGGSTGTADVSFHRLCYQGDNEFTIYLIEGRHIERIYREAQKSGRDLPVSINIGLDPAVQFAATFSEPMTPFGYSELNVAGALRGEPVGLARCRTVETSCIASAEIVIEGLITGERQPENRKNAGGDSLAEFLGYVGAAQSSLPVFRATAVTHRSRPIFQCLIGPGAELSNICGLSTEASIFGQLRKTFPGKVVNCYCPPSGGGKLSAVIQVRKESPVDDAVARQVGVAAFSAFHELKHVFLIDEDVDIESDGELLWVLNTRFQGGDSMITIPNLPCHPLDPSEQAGYTPNIRVTGTTWKTVFDCTFPYSPQPRARRA